ncbi:lysozyme-like [Chelonus insularis]|uniref:lysozyme-like n=1 Tax=Chelonus insularis TaxID=460826 RepID=UPI00158AED19|nr:lysozyme-like [Chelonus insularis]
MLKPIFIIVVIAFYINREIQAVTLTEDQLREQLRLQGFPENQINTWICLIMAESSGRTDAVDPLNTDGSRDYGLFQINSRYWCSDSGQPGNGCNVRCEDVMTDDITLASQCAKLIYKTQGFEAWTGWKNNCRG